MPRHIQAVAAVPRNICEGYTWVVKGIWESVDSDGADVHYLYPILKQQLHHKLKAYLGTQASPLCAFVVSKVHILWRRNQQVVSHGRIELHLDFQHLQACTVSGFWSTHLCTAMVCVAFSHQVAVDKQDKQVVWVIVLAQAHDHIVQLFTFLWVYPSHFSCNNILTK